MNGASQQDIIEAVASVDVGDFALRRPASSATSEAGIGCTVLNNGERRLRARIVR